MQKKPYDVIAVNESGIDFLLLAMTLPLYGHLIMRNDRKMAGGDVLLHYMKNYLTYSHKLTWKRMT